MEDKHKSLEEEIHILRSLNYDLQRKFIATTTGNKTPTRESNWRTSVSSSIEDPSLHIEDMQAMNNDEGTQPLILFEEVRFFLTFRRQY